MSTLDIASVRARFPALGREEGGRPVAYLDGPGGTQVSEEVIEAISDRLRRGTSNLDGGFASSREAMQAITAARGAVADLVGGSPDEIAFGQNMTSLTFAVSRALSRDWAPKDEVVVTRLDHDGNVTPWILAAEDRGARVRIADFDRSDGTLHVDHLASLLGEHTRLVAVSAASNALGTVPPLAEVAPLVHDAGALLYVDAVHYAPHRLIDVAALGADVLVCSAYKFFGPHTGILWGREALLEATRAYRLRAAPGSGPEKWETGTQSFEALAGVTAAVDYLASLGEGTTRRDRLRSAYGAIGVHEERLAARFLAGAAEVPKVEIFGITDPTRLGERAPTFALSVTGIHPDDVAARLADDGIYVWSGHYYALGVMEHLGVADDGGLVRIGFVHYNTVDEVDRVLTALDRIARA